MPEEVQKHTGILSVQDLGIESSSEFRERRDVNTSVAIVMRNWSNAPKHYRFYYDSKVTTSANVGNNNNKNIQKCIKNKIIWKKFKITEAYGHDLLKIKDIVGKK